jgi:hypothetical protein
MKKYNNKSWDECVDICNTTDGCVGFEYFVASGVSPTNPGYEMGDCTPNNGTNIDGCDYNYHQMMLFTREMGPCGADDEF